MRGDALQTFKNINCPTRDNLRENLPVFRRKYVKSQSMATAKHKFQKLVFNAANQKLVDFLDELQKPAKDAFGVAAHAIIQQFKNAKMPPHPRKSINQANLENGTYEQIVTHLEKELELNCLEAPDELQINTASHNTANTNAERPQPTCHHCKKNQNITEISVDCWKNSENKLKIPKIFPETKTVTPVTLTQTETWTIVTITTTTTKAVTELKGSQKLFIYPVRYVAKRTTPQRDVMLEPMQQTGHFPGRANRKDRVDINNRTHRTV